MANENGKKETTFLRVAAAESGRKEREGRPHRENIPATGLLPFPVKGGEMRKTHATGCPPPPLKPTDVRRHSVLAAS